MAPALMEAAATVSQNSGRKIKFVNSKILDNISNFASSREIIDKDIVTSCTAQAKLTTYSGRNHTIKAADNCSKNHNFDKDSLTKLNSCFSEAMEAQNIEMSDQSSPKCSEKQCSEESVEKLENTYATCALAETDGAKGKPSRSQPLAESTPYAILKEKTAKTNVKLQSLNHRARSLREKLRDFQANRLITHVKNQAQLMDNTQKISNDLQQKHDPQNSRTLPSTADKQHFNNIKSKRNVVSTNSVRQPSQLVNILKTNDSALSTCSKIQSTLSGPIWTTPSGSSNISLEDKKETFGILASQIDDIAVLYDPDATDSESDCDDDLETIGRSQLVDKLPQKRARKTVDEIWIKDRVKIGSMCTWIQAQIADLSHKVKRYGDYYQHAKSSRKQLILEETRQTVATPHETQKCYDDDLFGKNDLNSDSLQNNIFAKLHIHKNGLSAQQRSENKYEKGSGARTIPVAQLPKHKYVKRRIRSDARNVSETSVCPNLPTPFPCKQCQKASAPGLGKTTGNLSAVYLDHSYHEQLSTKYDMLLPHLLESTVRKEQISTGRKSLVPASSSSKEFIDQRDTTESKIAISKFAATAASTASDAKIRLDRKRQKRVSKSIGEDSELDTPQPKKRIATLSAASQLQKRASSLRVPSSGSGESRPSTPVTDNSLLSASCPSPSLSQLVKKKSRTSSEYDINNIVIPYSISSSTRLEKPQYKEILTPGWRPLERESQEEKNGRGEFEEDTSDIAYAHRHSQCEVVEHKRFTSYFQLPIRKSRTARKSSECNTPEPYSPLNPDHSNSSFGSVTTPTEFILATPSSGKMNRHNSFATLPLQQEDYKVVGWSQRTFPLAGDDLLQLSSQDDVISKSSAIEPIQEDGPEIVKETVSKIDTPVSCSPDNELISPMQISPGEEAPEVDEKWTVKLVTEEKPSVEEVGSSRKGIVLKLAKK